MLPTSTQSIFGLLAITCKSYKKLYIPFFKIAAVLFIIYLLANLGSMLFGSSILSINELHSVLADQITLVRDYSVYYFLVIAAASVFAVVSIVWPIYFTYKILADGVVNYVEPLKIAFKKFFSF